MNAVSKPLENLRILINLEKENYKQAIKDGKEFSVAKEIYLRIKKYNNLIEMCLQEKLS